MIALASVLLPLPDSPTTAMVLARRIFKLMSSITMHLLGTRPKVLISNTYFYRRSDKLCFFSESYGNNLWVYSSCGSDKIYLALLFFHQSSVTQHHHTVGQLGHHRQIVCDINGRRIELLRDILDGESTSIWVVTSSAVVGSSKMMISGLHAMAMATMARCNWPPDTW